MSQSRKDNPQELMLQKKVFQQFYYENKQEANRLGRRSNTSNNTKRYKTLKILTLKSTLLTQSNSDLLQVKQLSRKNEYAIFNIADSTAQAFLIISTKEAPRLKRVIIIIEWKPVIIKNQDDFIVGIFVQTSKDYNELVSEQKFKKEVLKKHQNYQIMNISRAAELSAKLNDFQSPQQFQRKRNLLFKTKPKQYNFKKDKRKMSKIQSEQESDDFSDHQRLNSRNSRDKNNQRQRSKSAHVKDKFKSDKQIENKEKSIKSEYRNKQDNKSMKSVNLIVEKVQKQNMRNLQNMPSKYRKIRLNFLIRRELYKNEYEQRFRDKISYERMYQHPNQQDFYQNSEDSYSTTSYRSSNRSYDEQQDFDQRQYR